MKYHPCSREDEEKGDDGDNEKGDDGDNEEDG